MSACLHIDLIDFVLFFNTESVSPLLLKIKNNLPFGFRLATGAIQLYNLVSHTPRYTKTHTHTPFCKWISQKSTKLQLYLFAIFFV